MGNCIVAIQMMKREWSILWVCGWWMWQMQCPPYKTLKFGIFRALSTIETTMPSCFLFSHIWKTYIAHCTNSEYEHLQQDEKINQPILRPINRFLEQKNIHFMLLWNDSTLHWCPALHVECCNCQHTTLSPHASNGL